jgi:hypothetical protein
MFTLKCIDCVVCLEIVVCKLPNDVMEWKAFVSTLRLCTSNVSAHPHVMISWQESLYWLKHKQRKVNGAPVASSRNQVSYRGLDSHHEQVEMHWRTCSQAMGSWRLQHRHKQPHQQGVAPITGELPTTPQHDGCTTLLQLHTGSAPNSQDVANVAAPF